MVVSISWEIFYHKMNFKYRNLFRFLRQTVTSEMHEIDNRERRKIHAMDFIRNQVITPILVAGLP